MAEALAVVGVAASIVQLVDFGSRVWKRLDDYQTDLGDIPESFRHIKAELPVLLDALRQTKSALGYMQDESRNALVPAIEGCTVQIKLLDDTIAKVLPDPKESRVRRSGKVIQSLRSDAKVKKITMAIRGYVQTLSYHAATSTNARATDQVTSRPIPSSTVPFRRDPHFVDRQVLHDINSKIQQPGSRVALIGLGGVGKSQLAVEYSYKLREDSADTWVFWIHASTSARFIEDYRKIADRAQLPKRENAVADVSSLIYDWLSNERNGKWAMVIDNADDMEVFTSKTTSGRTILDMIPQSSHGSVFVTSRSRDVAFRITGNYNHIIQVGPMDQAQSLTLLRRHLKKESNQVNTILEGATLLVEALDYMPLAISQAASYISRRYPRVTVLSYLQKFQKDDHNRAQLLKADLGDTRRDGTASNSIIATWQISFEYIRKTSPSVTSLLSLMSLFHRQKIPEAAILDFYQNDVMVNADFDDDLEVMLGFSLITMDVEGCNFEMHRLVQFSTIKWLEIHEELGLWKDSYAILMDKHYQATKYGDLSMYHALFPHAQAALASRPTSVHALNSWVSLLAKAMQDATRVGNYHAAQEMQKCVFETNESILGIRDENTLAAMGWYAQGLRLSGNYELAETQYRRLYQLRVEVSGPESEDTLSVLNGLALTMSERGNYEEAEVALKQTFEVWKRISGLENLSTLSALNNMGLLLNKRGKFDEAEKLHRKALQVHEMLNGKDNELTLASLDNLGIALGNQGKYDEAEEMHRHAWEGSRKLLGDKHPDTLIGARNLAYILNEQGKHVESETLHREVLAGNLEILGENHPLTLFSFNNLSFSLCAQEKYEEAEAIQRHTLAKREEVLGKEHPDTIGMLHNLALTLNSAGKQEEQVPLMERCVQLSEAVLGSSHPSTVERRTLLRQWKGTDDDDISTEKGDSKPVIKSTDRQYQYWTHHQMFILALLGGLGSLFALLHFRSSMVNASDREVE